MPRSKWAVSLAVLTSFALLVTGGSIAMAKKRGVPAGAGLGLAGAPGQQTADGGSEASIPPVDYTQVAGLSQPIYTTERKTYEVVAHDGINLYVEVEMPKNAPAGSRFPVILEASPYHGVNATRIGDRILPYPKVNNASIGLSGFFAPRGYAVAFMNLRGTGRSEGCLDHLGGNDAKDLKTVIEWLADQPWSNGKIGMAGHSYVGASQVVAAAQNPRGLVTIAPSAGLAGMYDHQFQMGVPYFLQYAGPQWSYEGIAMARHLPAPLSPATGVLFGASGDNFGNDMQYFGCGWQNSAFTAGQGQVTGQGGAWHAARDWADEAARWKGDVFMVHGVNDNAARIPAGEWFFKLRDSSQHPGDKVWLGQWDHSSSQMNFRQMQWTEALHAWFDNKLMGLDVDTGPPVEVFLNDEPGGNSLGGTSFSTTDIDLHEEVYTASSWPGPQSTISLFPAAADNSLSATPPVPGTKTYTSAAASAGTNGSNLGQPNGTFVEFTSAPLAEDTLLVGPPPKLRLSASVIGQRLNIITTLFAVGEDGRRRGINYCAINAELRNGVYTSSPIIPGQKMMLEPQCFTIGSLVRAGEKLVLRVGAASVHHLGTWTADPQVTIYTGPGESSLTLPVAPNAILHDDVLAEAE